MRIRENKPYQFKTKIKKSKVANHHRKIIVADDE